MEDLGTGRENENTVNLQRDVRRFMVLRERIGGEKAPSQSGSGDGGADGELEMYRKRAIEEPEFRAAALTELVVGVDDVDYIEIPGVRRMAGLSAKTAFILVRADENLCPTKEEIGQVIYKDPSLSKAKKNKRVGNHASKIRQSLKESDFEIADSGNIIGNAKGYYLREKRKGGHVTKKHIKTYSHAELETMQILKTESLLGDRDPRSADVFGESLADVDYAGLSDEERRLVEDYVLHGKTADDLGLDSEKYGKKLERLLKKLRKKNVNLHGSGGRSGTETNEELDESIEDVVSGKTVLADTGHRPQQTRVIPIKRTKPKTVKQRSNDHERQVRPRSAPKEPEQKGFRDEKELWGEREIIAYLHEVHRTREYPLNKDEFPNDIDIGETLMSGLVELRVKSEHRTINPTRSGVPLGFVGGRWVVMHERYSKKNPNTVPDNWTASAFSNPERCELPGDIRNRGFYRSEFAQLLAKKASIFLAIEGFRIYAMFRAKDSILVNNPKKIDKYNRELFEAPSLVDRFRLRFSRQDKSQELAKKYGFVLYGGEVGAKLSRINPELIDQ
ncbi:hypothetical protein ACFL2C_00480 [Patescibacteria group bacterium]